MSEAVKPRRWALWLPLGLFGMFVALVLVGLLWPASREVASALVGEPLPQFELRPAIAGRPGLATRDFTDSKPRLLNVFASWCVPCAIEAPRLQQLAGEGVEIGGIAIRDRREDIEAFLARHGNPYVRIGADDVSAVQLALGSSGVPETFVIDGKGVIRYQHIGDIRPEHMELLRGKLAEAAQ